jgi:hypothetical protein
VEDCSLGWPPVATGPSPAPASGAIVPEREICQRRIDHFRGAAIGAGVGALVDDGDIAGLDLAG